MITSIYIKNFRSIPELTLDLSKGQRAGNIALIYGENGAGKSHLLSALYMLLRTMYSPEGQDSVKELNSRSAGVYPELESEELRFRLSSQRMDLKEIARKSVAIGSSENIVLALTFTIGGRNGFYSLELSSDGKVKEERLYYHKGSRRGVLFSFSEESLFLSPSSFIDKSFRKTLIASFNEQALSRTFLSILISECRDAAEDRVSSSIIEVIEFLKGISIYSEAGYIAPDIPSFSEGYSDIASAFGLDRLERLLNSYVTKLFPDVQAVYYRTSYVGKRMYYELVFSKLIGGRLVDVPYSEESRGIKRVMGFFPYIVSSLLGGISFIDGLDEALHEVMASELIKRIDESAAGQIVMTTHNTNLMKSVDNSSIFILRTDGHGFKSISSIPSYSFRTQKHNNVQNRYLNGDYQGIPMIKKVDFKAIADKIIDNHYQ